MLRTVALVAAALSASLAVGCASNSTSVEAGQPLNNTGDVNGVYDTRATLSAQDAESDDAGDTSTDATPESTTAPEGETIPERLERTGESTPPEGEADQATLADYYLQKAEERRAALDYEGALQMLDFVRDLDARNAAAESMRNEIYAVMEGSPAYNAHRASDDSLRMSEARHTVMLKERDAQRFLDAGRYTDAIEAADAGLDIVRWSNVIPEEDDLLVRLTEIRRLATEKREVERLRSESRVREEQRRWEELEALAALESFRDEVRERFSQVQEHFDRKEYRACVRVLNQILQKDPKNSDVIELKRIATNLETGRRQDNARQEFNYRWQKAMAELNEAFAFPEDEIEFADPEYWAEVERRRDIVLRGQVTGQSAEDVAVRALLDSRRVNLEVTEGKTLGDVIAGLRRSVPEMNLIMISGGPDPEAEVQEIYISNITLRRALTILNRQAGGDAFKFYVADGAVIIDAEDAEGNQGVTRVFHVADLLISLRPFPGIEPRLSEDSTNTENRWGDDGEVVETDPLEGEDLADLIIEMFPEAWDDFNEPSFRQNMLVVNNEIEIVEQVEQLLHDLRRTQGLVVNIETRFITIRDDFLEDIGIDFRGIGTTPATNPAPVPAALDDVNFGTSSVPDGVGTDNEAGFFFQDIEPNRSVNQDIRARSELLFDSAVGGRRAGFGLTNSGGASFQLAFVDNPEINAILRAVQKKERATLLTAPRLAIHNTQRGNISLMNELSYISDFDVSVSAGASIADPVIEVIRDGIVLDVKPIVSADRRFVTIELRPTLATLLRPIATITTSLGVGPPVAIQTPELRLQRLRTTITVPDGGSFLIGGLRRLEETDLESGVPILSQIPLVGWLFTRKAKSTVRQDIIIIVSATIVDLEERTRQYTGQNE